VVAILEQVRNAERTEARVDAGEEVLTKPFTPLELTARLELVRGRAAATLTAA